MRKLLILYSSVVRGTASLLAAPSGPKMRPRVSAPRPIRQQSLACDSLCRSSALLKSLNPLNQPGSVTSADQSSGLLREAGRNLNWRLSIFSFLIRVSRVVDGTRSLAAAPDAPDTRPLLSASAASIISRSLSGSSFEASDVSLRGVWEGALFES